MALFSTRSNKREADNATARNVPIDSIETLRTRARQRLIGSVVLVALGIILFTVLFDSQPRPIPVDIPIIIPDKDKPDAVLTVPAPAPAPVVPAQASAAPTVAASTPSVTTPSVVVSSVASASAVPAPNASTAVQTSASLDSKEEIVTAKTNKKPDATVKTNPETKPETVKAEAKAMAILEGKTTSKTVTANPAASAATATNVVGERFIVQFGAYAENDKAREARLRVESTGLKTYVHVAETPQGKRIRLRVGPFATRAEAEKAAEKIKNLNLPAAILTL